MASAMAAGLTDKVIELSDVAARIDAREAERRPMKGRPCKLRKALALS